MPFDLKTARPLSGADLIPNDKGVPTGVQRLRDIAANAGRKQEKDDGGGRLFNAVGGVIEPVLSLGSGAIAGIGGMIRGGPIGAVLSGSKAKNASELEAEGAKFASDYTYQPRTESGQNVVNKIGDFLQSSGIEGIPIPELNNLARSMSTLKAAPYVKNSQTSLRGPKSRQRGSVGGDDGERLFHGTSGNHRELLASYAGDVSSGDGRGIWFTKSRPYAWEYAENAAGKRGGEPRIMEGRSMLKNPLVVEFDDYGRPTIGGNVVDMASNKEVIDYAIKKGHDGIDWKTGSFTDDPSVTFFDGSKVRITDQGLD